MMTTSTAASPARQRIFLFTRPYYKSAEAIVARENDRRFTHTALLRGANIVMPLGHITTEAMQDRLPTAKIVLKNTQQECFEMVREHAADVTVANVFTTVHYLNENPDARLTISGIVSEPNFPLRFGIRTNYPLLADILDRSLASISQEEMDEITSKHLSFGVQGSARLQLLKRRATQIIAVILAAGLLLWWRHKSIQKEVHARRLAENELREMNRSLEVFAHSISHDLKTPLRAIRGLTEALKEDYESRLDSIGKDYMSRIISATSRMDRLIHDVLAYSLATRANLPLEPVPLEHLVRRLVEETAPDQHPCFHIAGKLPTVIGNTQLLDQSISNLLSNAIKYVPKDRTPIVKVWGEEKQFTVRLYVEDNGVGIAEKDHENIFRLFHRVESEISQSIEGTGIGLAVVARAMESMGGSVGVESEHGKGSRFWIELPIQKTVLNIPACSGVVGLLESETEL